MTREELKVHCEKQIEMCEMGASAKGEEPSGKVYEEHKLILELLEQEPCDNAVSRQAVLDMMQMRMSGKELYKAVYELPPVNPQPKYEDIVKAFQFGLAFGFGEKYDETDRVIDEIKKVITPQSKTGCKGCIYEKTGNNSTYPCSHCGRCYTDKYKGESEVQE